ncbi:MAG: hypothetical protein PHG99_06185 [Erysipelotrichaceae bacterium]|nr:hypothetical protein [Erysipelotrichaceae bacterium]
MKTRLSIKRITIIVFILSILIATISLSGLIFSRWLNSANKMTVDIANDISLIIQQQMDSYLTSAWHVNDHNHKLIENKIIDLNDQKQRERFFVSTLASQQEGIYSFSIGFVNGDYHGARRSDDVIQIMRNDLSTDNQSWYYTLTLN